MSRLPKVLVPITLDRPRLLNLDFNALARFEAEVGRSSDSYMLEIMRASKLSEEGKEDESAERMSRAFGVRETRALLWAALGHEDKRLTLEQAGDLIGEAPGESFLEKRHYVNERLFKAWTGSQPISDQKKGVPTASPNGSSEFERPSSLQPAGSDSALVSSGS